MLAYHNDPSIKQQILEQLQGSGWNVFIEDYKNGLGIPKTLIYLHDAISRGLPNYLAKNWPIRFISAIQVGADLSGVWREFVVWMLIDPVDGVIQYTTPGTEVYEAIIRVAQLYRDGHTQQQMLDAAYAAINAAVATTDYTAVFSAYTAANAAHAAAYTDRAAALAAHAAAYVAAAYVASASVVGFYAYTASVVGFYAAYTKMSNKLIELLEKQEVKHVSLPQ